MIRTEAWVIHPLDDDREAELQLETLELSDLQPDEILAAPIYGCWEGNMSHALRRKPVDICRLRMEATVVLGNAGVVRVLEVGSHVQDLREGDACALIPVGSSDAHGFLTRVFGYDARGSVGMLAKRTKLKREQLYRIPQPSRHSLAQWAAISIRYLTAYDNWKVAIACYRAQMSVADDPKPWVWGWGGGVSLAELQLAASFGCRVAMIASTDARLAQIAAAGIAPVDRRNFPDLCFDAARFASDPSYSLRYMRSEGVFLRAVREHTGEGRVGIFIDNVGAPVLRATLRALGRQGVVTSSGWDQGGTMVTSRIEACMNRHSFVHTHGVRHSVAVEACDYMAGSDWMPPCGQPTWHWHDIPDLARRFTSNALDTYFPIFEINPDLA
ncbi:MAG: hypothetical protein RLZZ450_159 [Pseudomonadota bacterium]|jgi:NADPH:quinone reductase-like Zn-dependent oxidoreductase